MGGTAGYREGALGEERVHEARAGSKVLVELRNGKGGTYSVLARLRGTSDEGFRLTMQATGRARTVSRDSVAGIRTLGDQWG